MTLTCHTRGNVLRFSKARTRAVVFQKVADSQRQLANERMASIARNVQRYRNWHNRQKNTKSECKGFEPEE